VKETRTADKLVEKYQREEQKSADDPFRNDSAFTDWVPSYVESNYNTPETAKTFEAYGWRWHSVAKFLKATKLTYQRQITYDHVPHPKCGVRVKPVRNLLRIKPARQLSQFGIHGLFDRQNVADRIAQLAGNLTSGAVTVMFVWMWRFWQWRGESLGAECRLVLNRDLSAGFSRTGSVKELVVIAESEFSSVHTRAPVAISS